MDFLFKILVVRTLDLLCGSVNLLLFMIFQIISYCCSTRLKTF